MPSMSNSKCNKSVNIAYIIHTSYSNASDSLTNMKYTVYTVSEGEPILTVYSIGVNRVDSYFVLCTI